MVVQRVSKARPGVSLTVRVCVPPPIGDNMKNIIAVFAILAMLAVPVTLSIVSHDHDGEQVVGVVDAEQAAYVPTSTRCSRYGSFWYGSWYIKETNRFVVDHWSSYSVERKVVIIDSHRWLGGWPRHDNRTDCPYKIIKYI